MIDIKDILHTVSDMIPNVEYHGKSELAVSGFCELKDPKPNCITWAKSVDRVAALADQAIENLVIVVPEHSGQLPAGYNYIVTSNPKAAFFSIVNYLFVQKKPVYISPTATVETKNIGQGVSIGAHSFICEDVVIGDNVEIGNNVSIECCCTIGSNSIISSGAVIGNCGFGYYKDMQGMNRRVPHVGGVQIGQDVEIGSNTCIDRGTIGDTVIEDNVKIDNLCHIGHNVRIGKNSLVIALSMLGGSSVLEENSYIAPGVMVMNQITIGANSLAGMGAVVTGNVPAGKVVVGVPAKILRDNV